MEAPTTPDSKLKQGYIYAVRLMAMSNRSRNDIVRHMQKKGYDDTIIANVIDRREREGFLNEKKTLTQAVQYAIQGKRQGRIRMKFELKRKGYKTNLIDEALSAYSRETELDLARSLAIEQIHRHPNLDPVKKKKRLYDFLIRKGFDFNLCRDVVTETMKNPSREQGE